MATLVDQYGDPLDLLEEYPEDEYAPSDLDDLADYEAGRESLAF